MSYARFSADSDVYVYMHSGGWLECCGCKLGDQCFKAAGTQAMVEHLDLHATAGHIVPANVVPELLADDEENFTNFEERRRRLQQRNAALGGETP